MTKLERPERLDTDKLEALKDLFPQVFSDGKINFEALREELADELEELAPGDEHYGLNWPGKREAKRLAGKGPTGTLRPVPGEGVNEDTTKNLIIEGDNLEVLRIMQKAYAGRIKMIYIDPPYNTGNDFVYKDDFKEPITSYLEKSGQTADDGLLVSNPRSSGRYHSTWLSMMYPRLRLARTLLQADGAIFISIDDNELYNLKLLLDEIFGSENFLATFVWQFKKGGGSDSGTIVFDHEYVVGFARDITRISLSKIEIEAEPLDLTDDKGPYRLGRELNKWGANSRRQDRPTMFFPIPGPNGEEVYPIRNDGVEGRWRMGRAGMMEVVEQKNVEFVQRPDGNFTVYEKIRSTAPRTAPYRTWFTEVGTVADGSKVVKELFGGAKVFDFPKPLKLVEHLLKIGVQDEPAIILDFFSGSATTSHAVLNLNSESSNPHQFISIQMPEIPAADSEALQQGFATIFDVGLERIKRVCTQGGDDKGAGFRVLRLAQSHLRNSNTTEQLSTKQLGQLYESLERPFVEGWTQEGVITDLMLLEGYPLDGYVSTSEAFTANTVYQVEHPKQDTKLLICLDETIQPETIVQTAKFTKTTFICLDSALDDEAKLQLDDQITLKTL